jgi:hypothetical protein
MSDDIDDTNRIQEKFFTALDPATDDPTAALLTLVRLIPFFLAFHHPDTRADFLRQPKEAIPSLLCAADRHHAEGWAAFKSACH